MRAHAFLCLLAYYLEWHLRRKLAALPFEDAEREAAAAGRESPVERARVSESAKADADSKQTPEGLPVQSLETLLEHWQALTLNWVTLPGDDSNEFPLVSRPSPLQVRALELLGVDPEQGVSSNMPV